MVRLTEAGSYKPDLLTFAIAIVFILWELYVFSWVGKIWRLPLLHFCLNGIVSIYTFRELFIILQIIWLVTPQKSVTLHEISFSFVSLLIGLSYLLGTAGLLWNE